MSAEHRLLRGAARYERLLADAFRRAHWRVDEQPSHGPDLRVRRGPLHYIVEVKAAPEARRDRLVPLLSQAILQVQAWSRSLPEQPRPLAIVAAPHMSQALAEEVIEFAQAHAPDVSIGVIDANGFRLFDGEGLDALNAVRRHVAPRSHDHGQPPFAHMFSDLNQWMLKILLAPDLPEELLSAPRGRYRNASELAGAANVSVMSAFRCLRELRAAEFLDEQADGLRLARVPELLRRWQAAYVKPQRDLGMRWILPSGDSMSQLREALRSYAQEPSLPRACLGLFAAADALGVGFVHGVPPHVYLERMNPNALERLGLAPAAHSRVDLWVRIPVAKESVFRGAVQREQVRVADILQVWLEVGEYPGRGSAQAKEIMHRILQPALKLLRTS